MVRAVVFHHNADIREQLVDAFRHAGFITYDAADPQHAYQAVWTYRPQVVVTDFPALLHGSAGKPLTLTEAIRQAPAIQRTAVVNLCEREDAEILREADGAGVTRTLPATTPMADIIAVVQQVSRERGGDA